VLSYLAAVLVTAAAYAIHYLPFPPFLAGGRRPISAAILAIVLGVLVRNTITLSKKTQAASKQVAKKTLPLTVVLLGASLSLKHIAEIGAATLGIIAAAVVTALGLAWLAGRTLRVSPETALLVGAGTAICGNSAIAAVAPLIEAQEEDLFLSIGVINLLGLLAMLALPLAGSALALPDADFGVWAGATIHAVPQAIAGGFAFSPQAGSVATLTKLVRVGMLAPLALCLSLATAGRRRGAAQVDYANLVPWFLWAFLGVFVFNSVGWLPASAARWMTEAGNLALALAMAAVGLDVSLGALLKVGGKALAVGFLSWAGMTAAALGLIRILL
jgi:uncharacterized integral membrane protein (TIGR00698 family)